MGMTMPKLKLSAISSLQLFQLTRYTSFVLIGISFAKMGIAKAEIGRFENFLWWMGLFSFFWIAGLMNTVLATYPRGTEQEKKELLYTAFCLIMLLSAIAGLAQWLVGGSVLGLGYLLFNNASYIVEYILFLKGERHRLLIYGISIAIFQVLLCVVPAYIYGEVSYSLYGLLVIAAIKYLYVLYLLHKHTHTTIYISRIKTLLLLSLPLMLSFFVNGSAEYIDGAIVKHYFSLGDFSLFRYGSREFPLFSILAATLSMSFIPLVSANLQEGLQTVKDHSRRYMHFFFLLAIVLTLASHWLFVTFFSPQFATSASVFAALMLLTAPRLLFPQAILTALHENKWILVAAIIEMLVNIVVSVALAKAYGLVGVAYGTVVAFVVEKLIMIAILYFKHKIEPSAYVSWGILSLYSLLLGASYLMSQYI